MMVLRAAAIIASALFICLSTASANMEATRRLHQAVGGNVDDASLVHKALEAGADIDYRAPGSKQTALMTSALTGKPNMAAALLEKGADASIPEQDGYTPMHGCAFQGRAEVCKVLLAAGLDVNDLHSDGYIPLHRAIWGGEERHTETVRVLLDAGAQPDHGANKRMPLDMSSNRGTTRLLKKRLKALKAKRKAASEAADKLAAETAAAGGGDL